MEEKEYSPRMAFTVDGEVLFFDEKGGLITDMKKLKEDEFIAMFNDPKHTLQHAENISVFSFKVGNPECKIVITYPGGRFCCWVDCLTGRYIRPC